MRVSRMMHFNLLEKINTTSTTTFDTLQSSTPKGVTLSTAPYVLSESPKRVSHDATKTITASHGRDSSTVSEEVSECVGERVNKRRGERGTCSHKKTPVNEMRFLRTCVSPVFVVLIRRVNLLSC